MRMRTPLPFVLAGLQILAAGETKAPEAAVLKAQFQKAHTAFAKAFDHKDLDGFMSHFTADIAYQEKDGTKRDFAGLKTFMKGLMDCLEKTHKHVHTVHSVTVDGAEAHAKVSETWSFDIVDRISMFGPKDAPHKIAGEEAYDETWVKDGNDWKVKATTMTQEKMMVDGKPAQ
ncbi:hypothetical protein GETHLI_27410 [Geothrix limicola]|uniref:SnoaL-like domain-containing protein n=1 Tax=Geothrix limicola TaxID=2927978 RepID=A0ABQ5QI27_9BACT|nr:nuclear transport factor 2 family protein [Geothrix limicola]GLH74239.1 hypothetical protein GETHLI_27410 [Geothrix limicola]